MKAWKLEINIIFKFIEFNLSFIYPILFSLILSAFQYLSQVPKVKAMVCRIILREKFVGTVWILSTLIAYLIILHILIEKYLVSRMMISKGLWRQVSYQISIVNESESPWNFRKDKLSKRWISDPWTAHIVYLYLTVIFKF